MAGNYRSKIKNSNYQGISLNVVAGLYAVCKTRLKEKKKLKIVTLMVSR